VPLEYPDRLTETHIDDLPMIVNPVQSADLSRVLEVVPEHRRPDVVLAYLNITEEQWAIAAGMNYINVWRWLHDQTRFPFGSALRLAKVVGVPADLVFRRWI